MAVTEVYRNKFGWRTVLLVASVTTLLSACSTLKQAKLLEPTWFGLEPIAPRVYVANAVPHNKRQELLVSYEEGKRRIEAFYEGLLTDPSVYGCGDRACIQSFGGVGDGFAAGKLRPGILLWTKTFGAGEIAHEWSHLELVARVGRRQMRTVPMWFNEGLATVVGDIPRHSEPVYQKAVTRGYPIPPLSDLQTQEQWRDAFTKYPNPEGLNVVYATAGHEVRAWLQRVGHQGMHRLIEAIKLGESFDAAFSGIDSPSPHIEKPRDSPPNHLRTGPYR